jgi:hypothetical protein
MLDTEPPARRAAWASYRASSARADVIGFIVKRLPRRLPGSKLSIFDQQLLVNGGMSMKSIGVSPLVFIVMASLVSTSHSAGPSEERIRGAYRLVLSEADTNKDGKLSVSECKAGYKDPAMAEKSCKFWDADNDGIITEDEYVRQGMSFGKKK